MLNEIVGRMILFRLLLVVLLLSPTRAVPAPVTGVRLSDVSSSSVSGQAAINVTWTKPSSDRPIIRYHVQYGPSPARPDRWSNTVSVQGADTLTTTLTGLGRRSYDVRVLAVSGAGFGSFSATSALSTARVPPQVTGVKLSVVSGQAAVRVTWTKPSSDSTISRYVVQYGPSPAHSNGWTDTIQVQGADSLTTTLTGLGRRRYDVRVLAVSEVGFGWYSATSTLSTARVPSQVNPPTVTTAVSSGKPALTVSWSEPQSDSSITKYELQYRKTPSGDWMSRDATSTFTTLPNLDAGTEYGIRVRAVSGAGKGPFSTEKRQTTFNVPSQVTGVSLSIVAWQVTLRVNWNKPSVEGTFIRYDVQYRRSSQSWDASTTETIGDQNAVTFHLTNLQRGTTYNVRVRAVSNAGTGEYSAEATYTLPRFPPQVTGVRLSVVSEQAAIRVNWNIPSVEGTLLRYDVQYKTSVQSWDVSSTRKVIYKNTVTVDLPALQRGTIYKVRVKAVSNAGNGEYSAEATYTVLRLPSRVTGVMLSVVSEQAAIRVTWNIPSVEGTFLRYDVQYKTSVQSWDASRTRKVTDKNTVTVDLPSLQRGTTYKVRVKAVSNAGTGLYSAGATYTIPRPSSHVSGVSLSVVSGQAAIRVNWNKPSVDGIFIRYEVEYKTNSQSWASFRARTVTSLNVVTVDLTNLQRGTTYNVRVRAVTNASNAFYSIEVSFTLPRLPQQVAKPTLSRSVSSGPAFTVRWIKPVSYLTITGYDVQYKLSSPSYSDWMTVVRLEANTLSSLEYVLSGLSVDTLYDIRVRAVSAAGGGLYGQATERTYRAPSMVPVSSVNFTTTAKDGSEHISLTWKAPASEVNISHYEVMYRESGMTKPTFTSRTPTATIIVAANKKFLICIKAVSAVGAGKKECINLLTIQAPTVAPTSYLDSNVGLIVGVFVAGLVAGMLALLLMEGIVFGACKLTKQPNKNGCKETGSDPNAVEMTECPVYESVDKAYEDVDHPTQQRYVPRNQEYAIIN